MDFKIIAIDGPTGVGKSTIARQLAEKLGYLYVDTGAMFRCLAWRWGKQGCPESDHLLEELGDQTRIVFKDEKVICDDNDVTQEIRTERISGLASRISRFPLIREVLKKQQTMYFGAVLHSIQIFL